MTAPSGQYSEFTSTDQHRFRAFFARPSQPPRAALVLLHEMDARSDARVHSTLGRPMPGLSQRIRGLVNEYASRGYLVIAPSLFGRGKAGQDHGYKYQMTAFGEQLMQPLQSVDTSRAMLDVQRVVSWAQGQVPQGKVGIMGFCWGGLLAWRAACSLPQIFAATAFYGGGMTDAAELSRKPLCPVLAHFPTLGTWMAPASLDEFQAEQGQHLQMQELKNASPFKSMVQIERYEAAYGFDQAGTKQHHAVASASAHQKTRDFFAQNLHF